MFGHAGNVVSEGCLLLIVGGVEAKELSKSPTVLGVLVYAELDVLAESSVKLLKLITILRDLIKHLKSLLDKVPLDDLHDLVLLESLTRQVERKILRVDDTLDESEPLWDQVSAVISDENTANVEFNVVLGPLGLEEIERSTLWNEEDSAELKLTLNGEVLDCKMILPIVGQGLVKRGILLRLDICGASTLVLIQTR